MKMNMSSELHVSKSRDKSADKSQLWLKSIEVSSIIGYPKTEITWVLLIGGSIQGSVEVKLIS